MRASFFYSLAVLLAGVGAAAAFATHDWRGAALCGLVVVAGIILRPTSIIAALPPTVVAVLSILVHGWLTVSVAAMYLLSWAYSWAQHRQDKPAEFSPADLARAISRLKPALAAALDTPPSGSLVTSMHLLKAAVAADPHRWRSVAITEPAWLSGEGGELPGTGWTIVAGEAALVAEYLPHTGPVPDIHDLAMAAMLLPNASAQRAASHGEEGVFAAVQVAGLPIPAIHTALMRAAQTSAGALIRARLKLDHDHRPVTEMTIGDWRQRINPARGGEEPPPSSASADPPSPAKSLRVGSPDRPARISTARGAAESARGSFRAVVVGPLLNAWRPSARLLWLVFRPLASLVAVADCLLSLRLGANPFIAVGAGVCQLNGSVALSVVTACWSV
jgi:hypothetical protein